MAHALTRAIGPAGTVARIVVGAALFALAFVGDGSRWSAVVLGLIGFPAVLTLVQWFRLRFSRVPLRATGPLGFAVNAAVVAVLLIWSATREATVLWLGASMLLAAWRGYAGCESLAISNWLLRRDDQVGCLLFSPLDELEAQVAGTKIADPARRRSP